MTFEPTTPTDRLEVFALAHGLSVREREVLGLLATGLDSRELAATLFLSEHTVNDHVKAVLAKTSTRTRQALLVPCGRHRLAPRDRSAKSRKTRLIRFRMVVRLPESSLVI